MEDSGSSRAQYEALKERASESVQKGKLKEALDLFDRAHEVARRLGERDLEDVAFCNRSAVAIRLGIDESCLRSLRQMLMRTSSPRVAYLSSYNLSQACDVNKDYRKALFYARIAVRYAAELGEVDHQAAATNQIGNALVALNDFAGGLKEYQIAHSLVEHSESERQSLILANLGYSQLLTGMIEEGLRTIIRALRMARRLRAPAALGEAHLCLSFAYLMAGRPWYALHHGSQALEQAEALGDEQTMKYALLLLGEGYKQGGKVVAARECFELLQRTYYPGMGEVPEMLLGVDICRVINLRG